MCRRTTNVSPHPYHCVAAQPMCLPNRAIVSPTLLTKISCFFYTGTFAAGFDILDILYICFILDEIWILLLMESGYFHVNMLSFWNMTSYPFEILQCIYYTLFM